MAKVLKEKFNYITPPEHLLYFSPNTLKQLLKNTGFNIVKVKTYGRAEDFGGIYRFLREKWSLKRENNKLNPTKMDKNIKVVSSSGLKRVKHDLFEKTIREMLYPLLNIGLNGSMIEVYFKKNKTS